ncbi:HNH endonuclease [Microbacterium neungamense]|uniref:HNH endonuclease n=1 Tax=Microbacterium TaxID=33882 RepID=UPI003D819DE3
MRDGGGTDLSNGILLCVACHHRIHDDGWEIRIEGTGVTATPVFIPPPWLDPQRTPRRGGRARFDLAA